MARIDNLSHFLTDLADAVRARTGTSDPIQASNFDTIIENLPGGNADTIGQEMRKYDLMEYWYGGKALITERDYTQSEVDKVDNLLTLLEGGNV